ncbi:MAG: DNA primase, partial [Acidobacteria bacterium]|nr:DNA primase [Acidobacteriota bacterium]
MDFAPHVKSSVDIVAVVGEYVRLKKHGARFVGLCPFHSEKAPSFGVHPGLQFFKCFGCGKGGDVFNFLMEIEGMSFFEALKTLAEQHGIPLPKRGPDAMADEETRLRAAL